jgi:hypothetical protein
MNTLSDAIEHLRFAVRTLPGILGRFSEAEREQRPAPEHWPKKEVVGHLIDSASNNHQRFVRGQIASEPDFPGYEQEQWVRIQGYQSARWSALIDMNLHDMKLSRVGARLKVVEHPSHRNRTPG